MTKHIIHAMVLSGLLTASPSLGLLTKVPVAINFGCS
jgi:hypothetical protein